MTDLPADLTADQLVTLPAEADVVICGAGPIGAATATFLARPGLRVVLVDHDPAEDPETPPTNFQAVRTDRYLYAEYGTGEQELYDLFTDPYELQSQHANPAMANVKGALDRLLGAPTGETPP